MVSASLYSYGCACMAYAVFALVLALSGARTWLSACLALASAGTALWAGAVMLNDLGYLGDGPSAALISARDAAWLVVLLALLRPEDPTERLWRPLAAGAAAMIAVDAVFGALQLRFDTGVGV